MKVSLNWLQDYVPVTLGVEELSRLLTFAGVEVEAIQRTGTDAKNVVVAKVVASERHPDADRLSVCQVEDGGDELRQIVCGAKNYKVGDKVPLALPGAVLPGNFKIKKGKLRGVASNGMLCSAKELELAEDADGLMILAADAPVGMPISDWLKGDTIIEIEVTPNRPDLLGYLGIARELAALTGGTVKRPEVKALAKGKGQLQVRSDDADACPYYSATRIAGVAVGPSPAWLVEKLTAAGLRPINSVVDITNFVLLETGQPLHAFDADKLSGGINVRFASDGETIVALDGEQYDLDKNNLVIADDSGPVAVAGVMGGEPTGVTEQTSSIILESALFAPAVIRRTSRKLGLFSDSSYRFERGVDPLGVAAAAARAAQLIVEIAGGKVTGGLESCGSLPDGSEPIALRDAKCQSVMGYEVERERIIELLRSFGLELSAKTKQSTTWQVPSFRPDLTREIDLVEEVARVEGLDKVPAKREAWMSEISEADRVYDFQLNISRYLAGAGYFEARSLTLISSEMAADDIFEMSQPLAIRNPLGADSAILRPSLLPGLLKAAALNVRQGTEAIQLFEIGRVFSAQADQEERTMLAQLLTGKAAATYSWHTKDSRLLDIFDMKGAFESLPMVEFEIVPCTQGKAALAAKLAVAGVTIGFIGQLDPARARQLGIEQAVLLAELDLGLLRKQVKHARKYSELPKFPAVTRDISLVVPAEVSHAQIEAVLTGTAEPLLNEVRLFDVFTDPEGKKLPADKKSMAYSLTYRSPERTLTADEVSAAHSRIMDELSGKIPAELRD